MRHWCLLMLSAAFVLDVRPASAGLLDQGQSPQAAAGVPWNSRADGVKKRILARGDVTLTSESPEQLRFSGGNFADQSVLNWLFDFKRGLLQSATVRFIPNDPQNQYQTICRNITAKYGKPGSAVIYRRGEPYGQTSWVYAGSLNGRWRIVCEYTAQGVALTYEDHSGLEFKKAGGLQAGSVGQRTRPSRSGDATGGEADASPPVYVPGSEAPPERR